MVAFMCWITCVIPAQYGRCFGELTANLDDTAVCLVRGRFLTLDVMDWPGAGLNSVDNQRLLCIEIHQENVPNVRGKASVR